MSKDPEVKQWFINHFGCPEFPYSEWDNIIIGQPINLDVVLSDVYAGPGPVTITTAPDWLSHGVALRSTRT